MFNRKNNIRIDKLERKMGNRIYMLECKIDSLFKKFLKLNDQVVHDKKTYIRDMEILDVKVNCKHPENARTFEILHSCIGTDYREMCSHCVIFIKEYDSELEYTKAELCYIKLKNKEKEDAITNKLKDLK